MYEQNAKQFVELSQKIKSIENLIEEQVRDANDPNQWEMPLPERGAVAPLQGIIVSTFQEILRLCNNLDLKMTGAVARRFMEQKHRPTYGSLVNVLRDINSRLSDELESRIFISLSSEDMRYYRPTEYLFGLEFDVKFADNGVFEVDEAAKCLALGRSTAAVFHLMRAMEVGIRAVARCLGIPDPLKPAERNWGSILKSVKDGIDARWPASSARVSGDGALFEQITFPWMQSETLGVTPRCMLKTNTLTTRPNTSSLPSRAL